MLEELISEGGRREHRAEELHTLWQAALDAARRSGARREDAEDIASSTVECFLENRRPGGSPEGWVRVVARRRGCKLVRRERRLVSFAPEHDRPAPLEPELWRSDLCRIGRQLSLRDRRLLGLAASGASHEEIGRRVGLRTSAVGAYLARALERARRISKGAAPGSPSARNRSSDRKTLAPPLEKHPLGAL